jgi:acetyl esterase/lipase
MSRSIQKWRLLAKPIGLSPIRYKEKWEYEIYWSFSTPFTILVPNCKRIPVDLYNAEFIVIIRMRGYMMEGKEGKAYIIHSIMADNESRVISA